MRPTTKNRKKKYGPRRWTDKNRNNCLNVIHHGVVGRRTPRSTNITHPVGDTAALGRTPTLSRRRAGRRARVERETVAATRIRRRRRAGAIHGDKKQKSIAATVRWRVRPQGCNQNVFTSTCTSQPFTAPVVSGKNKFQKKIPNWFTRPPPPFITTIQRRYAAVRRRPIYSSSVAYTYV